MTATFGVAADFESLRAIGSWLKEMLEGISPDLAQRRHGMLELAVHEIATNCVDHAGATGTLHFSFDSFDFFDAAADADTTAADETIRVVVTDNGAPWNEMRPDAPAADEPQVRGYGFMIVESLARSIDYRRHDGRNIWTLDFDR